MGRPITLLFGRPWVHIRIGCSIRLTRPRFRRFVVPVIRGSGCRHSVERTTPAVRVIRQFTRVTRISILTRSLKTPRQRFPTRSIHGHARQSNGSQRGMFVNHREMKFRDVLDGLANTVMGGEIATDLGDNDKRTTVPTDVGGHAAPNEKNQCRLDPSYAQPYIDPKRPQFWEPTIQALTKNVTWGRGYRWHDFEPPYTQMTTVLPPNSELCSDGRDHRDVVSPPSSRHQGGVHVLMGDGAVVFITDSIEAGDRHAPQVSHRPGSPPPGSPSPYGLWGALGSRAAKEVIEEQLNQ